MFNFTVITKDNKLIPNPYYINVKNNNWSKDPNYLIVD